MSSTFTSLSLRFRFLDLDNSDGDSASTYASPPKKLLFFWRSLAFSGDESMISVDFLRNPGL
jgi:hypothetical protein